MIFFNWALFLFALLLGSCKTEMLCDNIYINRDLIDEANNQNTDYQDEIKKVIQGDKKSLKKLCLIDFETKETMHNHGENLVKLLECLGDSVFCEAIKGLNEYEMVGLYVYFKIGLDALDEHKYNMRILKKRNDYTKDYKRCHTMFFEFFDKIDASYESIYVDWPLEHQSNEHNINYWKEIKRIMAGDTISLKKVCQLRLDTSAAYNHGENLVQLLECLGDSVFCEVTKDFNENEIAELQAYFIAGLDRFNKQDLNNYKERHTAFFKKIMQKQ